ncbi:MAG: glycerol-3-phosphate 1-O-acyltransferase PlsY [Alphaproteobacteria bacterium]|nr:glycerol-3-phosphate 1-O-acyltransferase PlsY [Alphaproteobacteria bacterium]
MDLPIPCLLAVAVIGYGLGSTPFGLLLTRAAGLGDVRTIGSGNIGATNVLRTGNKSLAATTLLLDLLKGAAAVLVGIWLASHLFHASPTGAYNAGLAAGFTAFLGHLFPVWLKFKGGKGVATYIGVLLGAAPLLAAVFCVIWLTVAGVSRLSSLAALIASIATPLLAFATGGAGVMFYLLAAMTLLVLWKHRDNIARLRRGEESKIGNSAN